MNEEDEFHFHAFYTQVAMLPLLLLLRNMTSLMQYSTKLSMNVYSNSQKVLKVSKNENDQRLNIQIQEITKPTLIYQIVKSLFAALKCSYMT